MTITVVRPPAVEPVALADLRQFLRLSGTGEDALLSGLLKAARETLETLTGLVLIKQQLRFYTDRWPNDGLIRIDRYPVQSVVSVTA
ncbi:phage head-tail connector protein, partial [Escherichia coli]|nr:phage head-tail connector protein [Escherichia coli]